MKGAGASSNALVLWTESTACGNQQTRWHLQKGSPPFVMGASMNGAAKRPVLTSSHLSASYQTAADDRRCITDFASYQVWAVHKRNTGCASRFGGSASMIMEYVQAYAMLIRLAPLMHSDCNAATVWGSVHCSPPGFVSGLNVNPAMVSARYSTTSCDST